MNLFQSITMGAIIAGISAGTAFAQGSTIETQAQPQVQSTSQTGHETSVATPASQEGKIQIGETYQEHMNKEIEQNAAAQSQQGQGQ